MVLGLLSAEKPLERLRNYGPFHLSKAKLLAIILQNCAPLESDLSLSARLLSHFGALKGLARANYYNLGSIHGLGEAKMAQVKSQFELGMCLISFHESQRAAINSPKDAASPMQCEIVFLEQERLCVVLLNSRNRVLVTHKVCRSNVHSTVIEATEEFRRAMGSGGPGVVVAHNDSCNDPIYNQEDILVTEQLVFSPELTGIERLDHSVVAQSGFIIIQEKDWGFDRDCPLGRDYDSLCGSVEHLETSCA